MPLYKAHRAKSQRLKRLALNNPPTELVLFRKNALFGDPQSLISENNNDHLDESSK